jgi:hypothetical protein
MKQVRRESLEKISVYNSMLASEKDLFRNFLMAKVSSYQNPTLKKRVRAAAAKILKHIDAAPTLEQLPAFKPVKFAEVPTPPQPQLPTKPKSTKPKSTKSKSPTVVATATRGCSRLRKQTCTETAHCKWTVGKRCSKRVVG